MFTHMYQVVQGSTATSLAVAMEAAPNLSPNPSPSPSPSPSPTLTRVGRLVPLDHRPVPLIPASPGIALRFDGKIGREGGEDCGVSNRQFDTMQHKTVRVLYKYSRVQ
jgi:hypothetical protein